MNVSESLAWNLCCELRKEILSTQALRSRTIELKLIVVGGASEAEPQVTRRRLGREERPADADQNAMLATCFGYRHLIGPSGQAHPDVHPSPRQARHSELGSKFLERLHDHPAAFPQRTADLDDVPRPT